MSTVLIAGCGDLGTAVGLSLCERGHTVLGLRRQADRIPAPIRPIAGDFSRPDGLPELPGPLDAVYFIATPGRFEDEAYRLAYVEGMRNLLAALDQAPAPPKRVIMVSSTSVYGVTDGSWVDESTPAEPAGFSGERLRQAESLLQASGLAHVIVRFGGIYGPGRERMLRKLREEEPIVDTPPRYSNRIHRDDCIGVLLHLFDVPDPEPLYLAVDDTPCTQAELLDWLADETGLPRPPRTAGSPGGPRGSNKRCSNARLRGSGYRLLHPTYQDGYRALLNERGVAGGD